MRFPKYIRVIGTLVCLLACLISLAPILVVVGASLTSDTLMSFPPKGFSLRWYQEVFATPKYLSQLTFSLFIAVLSATASLVIGVLAALALGRSKATWAGSVVQFLMSPLVVPQVVMGAALMQYFSILHLQGTGLALALGHVLITVPYVMRSVVGAVTGIGDSLLEASMDLGASRSVTYALIILPIIRIPAIGGWLFAFVMSWINVELSIFLAPGTLATTPVEIFNHIQYSADPLLAALASLSAYLALVIVGIIDRLTGIERIAR